LKYPENGFDYSIGIVEYIVVPKPDDTPALPLQKSRTTPVRNILCMLICIDFDNQCMSSASKIDDKGPDWMLPAKFVFFQSTIAQGRPHAPLGVGCIPPQLARSLARHQCRLPGLGKRFARRLPSPGSLRSPPSPALRERG
jgi:hypothetical protein